MKIISFINERPVIRKILEHLNLWNDPRKQRPPPRAGLQLPQQDIENIPNTSFSMTAGQGLMNPYMAYD